MIERLPDVDKPCVRRAEVSLDSDKLEVLDLCVLGKFIIFLYPKLKKPEISPRLLKHSFWEQHAPNGRAIK